MFMLITYITCFDIYLGTQQCINFYFRWNISSFMTENNSSRFFLDAWYKECGKNWGCAVATISSVARWSPISSRETAGVVVSVNVMGWRKTCCASQEERSRLDLARTIEILRKAAKEKPMKVHEFECFSIGMSSLCTGCPTIDVTP